MLLSLPAEKQCTKFPFAKCSLCSALIEIRRHWNERCLTSNSIRKCFLKRPSANLLHVQAEWERADADQFVSLVNNLWAFVSAARFSRDRFSLQLLTVPSVGRVSARYCVGRWVGRAFEAHAAWMASSERISHKWRGGRATDKWKQLPPVAHSASPHQFHCCRRRLYQRQWTWKGVLHRSNLIFYVLWLPLHILRDAAAHFSLPVHYFGCNLLLYAPHLQVEIVFHTRARGYISARTRTDLPTELKVQRFCYYDFWMWNHRDKRWTRLSPLVCLAFKAFAHLQWAARAGAIYPRKESSLCQFPLMNAIGSFKLADVTLVTFFKSLNSYLMVMSWV